jgi:RND family efflux transporter MFP subunit
MQTKYNFNRFQSSTAKIPVHKRNPESRLVKTTGFLCFQRPAVLLLSLAMLLALPCCAAAAPAGPGAGPPLVTVVPVAEQDVNPPAEYVGHVEAVQSVDLRARVEGFLEQVNFREGSDVRAGDLLYVIEQGPYQARVDADKALMAQAEATLTKARQYLQRTRTVRPGGVSASDLDNAVAEELRAKAQLEEVGANLRIAQIDLGYTEITAPISGRIGRNAFTRGNLVNPASGPLARIVQLDPIRVVYSVSENDLVFIKMALKDAHDGKTNPMLLPRIKLSDGQILDTTGRVDFVDNAVDAGTGTIAIRALFKNPDGTLLPGQYVTVLVARNAAKILPVVPLAAVQEDQDGRYVLVVDGQSQVGLRRVKTGTVVGTNWAIKSGLTPKEMVIVQGVQKVTPGMVVKAVVEGQGQGR